MAQQTLFGCGEQLVTPIEHGAQGTMLRECRAASACQEREAIVQACGHLMCAKGGSVRGGEFDRQRDAIEMPADRTNAGEFAGAWREARVQRRGAGDKELDRAM